MIQAAKIFYIVFGLLTIAGGVMGYVNKASTASLIAGGVAGAILLVAAFLLPGKAVAGLVVGGLISLALAGRFIPVWMKTGDWFPAGMISLLSVVSLIITVAAFFKR